MLLQASPGLSVDAEGKELLQLSTVRENTSFLLQLKDISTGQLLS